MTTPSLFIASPGAGYLNTASHFGISSVVGRAMRMWERRYGPDAKCGYSVTVRLPVDKARNQLAQAALDGGFDWIFWIDDDMDPPADVVERLMAHDAPIASGLCSIKVLPPAVMAYVFIGGMSHIIKRPEWDGVHTVDAVGTACVLMKREVLQYVWDKTEGCPFQYGPIVPATGKRKYGTEDLYFFELASEAGYKVTLDTSIVVPHIGPHAFMPNAKSLMESAGTAAAKA